VTQKEINDLETYCLSLLQQAVLEIWAVSRVGGQCRRTLHLSADIVCSDLTIYCKLRRELGWVNFEGQSAVAHLWFVEVIDVAFSILFAAPGFSIFVFG
jgi:hypothetical protein